MKDPVKSRSLQLKRTCTQPISMSPGLIDFLLATVSFYKSRAHRIFSLLILFLCLIYGLFISLDNFCLS